MFFEPAQAVCLHPEHARRDRSWATCLGAVRTLGGGRPRRRPPPRLLPALAKLSAQPPGPPLRAHLPDNPPSRHKHSPLEPAWPAPRCCPTPSRPSPTRARSAASRRCPAAALLQQLRSCRPPLLCRPSRRRRRLPPPPSRPHRPRSHGPTARRRCTSASTWRRPSELAMTAADCLRGTGRSSSGPSGSGCPRARARSGPTSVPPLCFSLPPCRLPAAC